MKKHLISNLVLSLSALATIIIADTLFNHQLSKYYYLTIGFFFLIYLLKALFLFKIGKTPSGFLVAHNYTTIFKMLSSISFLILYYLVFEKTIDATQKIYFSVFFLGTYFVYLVVNTIVFFRHKS